MAASDDENDSFYYQPVSSEFCNWPLDLDIDDDEFRAGYPFDNISDFEYNENEKSNDELSILDDVICQLNSSHLDDSISKEQDKEQILDSIHEENKVVHSVEDQSSHILSDTEDHQLNFHEDQNHDEKQCNGDVNRLQCDSTCEIKKNK